MYTEISKDLDPRLYADVVAKGGLVAALRDEIANVGGQLLPGGIDGNQFIVYAIVKGRTRESQVMIAAHERAFSVDFWDRGVKYGAGWTSQLGDVAVAIVTFAERGVTIAELVRDFSWIEPTESGRAHEQGRLVEDTWLHYTAMPARALPVASLAPLVQAASRCLELRQLLPFTSLDRLCFSRTTGYPYTTDCPHARPLRNGRFLVVRRDATGNEEVVGEGAAEEAVAMLVASLPANCGAAVDGTAEDL